MIASLGDAASVVSAVATAIAALAAWAAVRVAVKSMKDDRRSRMIASLGFVHEELLAARDVVDSSSWDAEALEAANHRLNAALATAPRTDMAVRDAVRSLLKLAERNEQENAVLKKLSDAASIVEEKMEELQHGPLTF